MRLSRIALWMLWIGMLPAAGFGAQSTFDAGTKTWTIGNGWIRAIFQLTPDGYFLARQVADLQSGDQWNASPGRPASPVNLQASGEVFNATRLYRLHGQYAVSIAPAG